jgi:histidinol-phosphate/aromatic aminotransferase/cobyric acid decarboxylase-like protein
MSDSKPDDLSIAHEEGIKELDKVILSKGAWTTILYKLQKYDNRKEEYGQEQYTIRRYQKREGQYQQKSRFNISSREQARKIIEALQNWQDET